MIERERRKYVHSTLEVARVVCDRCGSELRRVDGIGVDHDFPWEGCRIQGRLYPDSGNAAEIRLVEAELCQDCESDLVAWIAAGRASVSGPGARVETAEEMAKRVAGVVYADG